MEKDLISVIVPVYNVKNLVSDSLESIINQKYKNLEIIVINDGSRDGSEKICEKYAKKDKRIKLINQTNKGLSSARNRGMELARGKYISFIDSDDIISNEFFSHLYKLIIDTKSDISECDFKKISEEDVFSKKYDFNIKEEENWLEFDSREALNRLHNEKLEVTVKTVVVWNKLYKKELFDNIRFPEGKRYEDDFTTYKLLQKINKMVSTNKVLYNYVQRKKSIMHEEFSLKRLDALEVFDNYIEVFSKEDKYLYDKCLVRHLRVLTTILDELYNSNYEDKKMIKNILKERYSNTIFILQEHLKYLNEEQKEFIKNAINMYNEKFYEITQKL